MFIRKAAKKNARTFSNLAMVENGWANRKWTAANLQ
jgi:hypothetical protein